MLLLYQVGVWDISLLKDTIFWLVGAASVLSFSVNEWKSNQDVFKAILSLFKWSILLEFLSNMYTFSIGIELILVPIVTLLGLMKQFTQAKFAHAEIQNVIRSILTWIGLFFLGYILYKTITGFSGLITMVNLKSLIIAPVLSIMFIPFVYGLAVLVAYSDMLLRVKLYWNNEAATMKWRRAILRIAGVNLTRIYRIKRKINKNDLVNAEDLNTYLKGLIIKQKKNNGKEWWMNRRNFG